MNKLPYNSFISIPKMWPGATVVCIGGGPSLSIEQVNLCEEKWKEGKIRVIGINDAYRIAPWIDILYAADKKWWMEHSGVPNYKGLKIGIEEDCRRFGNDIHVMRNTGSKGLERNRDGLRTGSNSGYQAINLAFHLGASKIILIGYDMKLGKKDEKHWFGDHPWRTTNIPFQSFLSAFPSLRKETNKEGVEVINCTPESALDSFKKGNLIDVL